MIGSLAFFKHASDRSYNLVRYRNTANGTWKWVLSAGGYEGEVRRFGLNRQFNQWAINLWFCWIILKKGQP